MSTLGKIFGSLLLVSLFVAFWLSGTMLAGRKEWLDKIDAKQKQLAALESGPESVASVRRQFEVARNELDWEVDNWGQAWQAPNSGASPVGDGSIELGVGANAGLGRGQQDPAKLPVVYVLGPDAQGKQTYLGDFKLMEVRQDTAGGKLTRVPFQGEVQSWPRGELRVREEIPGNFRNQMAELRTLALIAEQHVRQENDQLKIQEQHIAASQVAVDKRMAELNGNPEAPEKAGEDVKDGLVQTLRREETARNTLAKEVDALRRLLSDKHLLLTKILEGNNNSVKKLGTVPVRPNRVAQKSDQ